MQKYNFNQKSRGLGDTVAKVAYIASLGKLTPDNKSCGCKKRQDALNKLVPYGTPVNPVSEVKKEGK